MLLPHQRPQPPAATRTEDLKAKLNWNLHYISSVKIFFIPIFSNFCNIFRKARGVDSQ